MPKEFSYVLSYLLLLVSVLHPFWKNCHTLREKVTQHIWKKYPLVFQKCAPLETQIMHTESCDGVAILETVLTVAEAQVLAIQLDNILLEASCPHQDQNQKVNWQQEGF